MKGTSKQCRFCPKKILSNNLYRHMVNIHGFTEEDMILKEKPYGELEENGNFICSICQKEYLSLYAKKRHMNTVHGSSSQMDVDCNKGNKAWVLCPGCPAAFSRNIQLAQHCQENHSNERDDFAIVRKNFDDVAIFKMTMLAEGNIEVVAFFGHYSHDLRSVCKSKRVKGNIAGRKSRNLKRHKEALAYYKDKESRIMQTGGRQWYVPSKTKDGIFYTVTIREAPCECDHEMNSHCQRCGVCASQVDCTCCDEDQAGLSHASMLTQLHPSQIAQYHYFALYAEA